MKVLNCAKASLLYGKDTYSKWREIYSKYLQQSLILIKYITLNWVEFKNFNFNDLKQTIIYFEKNSALYLQNAQQQQKSNGTSKPVKQAPNQTYIQEFNRLTKVSLESYFPLSTVSFGAIRVLSHPSISKSFLEYFITDLVN